VTVSETRPVLMSRLIAERLNCLDRWTIVDPFGYEGGAGVAWVTEAELLVGDADHLDWNEPDAHGWYTPTFYNSSSWPSSSA